MYGSVAFTREDLEENRLLFPLNLQLFANDEGGEKTEEATPKKLDDARKEGQVAKSQELATAVTLIALFGSLKVFVGFVAERFAGSFPETYNVIDTYYKERISPDLASSWINSAMGNIIIICLPMFLVAMTFVIVINVAQVKWKPTAKPLMPKFSKLNPINGFKRIISMEKLFDLFKAIVKIGVVGYLAYSELSDSAGFVNSFYDMELFDAVIFIGGKVIDFGFKVAIIYLVIGIGDYIYQKFKFNKDMRMTKQEIKDEFKQTEGDPKIKGQIRQKMREASQRRMMQQLPEADVVITNPTHLACAIKYDKQEAEAPILLAKGADYLANRIKEEAKKHDIPIVENKPLARMLYHNVEINEEIPEELYQMTAEVLAYVYSLKGE